jgi:hypothetical protein
MESGWTRDCFDEKTKKQAPKEARYDQLEIS